MSPALRPAVARRLAVGGLAAALLGVGAVAVADQVRGPQLADRSLPATRAEEARDVQLLARAPGSSWLGTDPDCRARLLRHEGSTSWVWAICQAVVSGPSSPAGGWAGPVRIDGNTVTEPDQATYVADVERLFPADLVDVATTGNNRFLVELGVPTPSPAPAG